MSRLLLIMLFFFSVSNSWSANYAIDKAHSQIGFDVTHMVITTVDGQFGDYDVKLSFDPNDLSAFSVEAVIKIASINTENAKRDDHLRSNDFFDAGNHPDMIFKSSKVEKKGDGYVAHGTLTIRGVSKPVDLSFTVKGPVKDSWGNTRIGIKASTQINRHDFGVSWSKTLDGGGLVVSDEVDINIDASFIQQ